jgi:hypothetical protein
MQSQCKQKPGIEFQNAISNFEYGASDRIIFWQGMKYY